MAKASGTAAWMPALTLAAWTVALAALGSAFAPLSRSFLRVLHTAVTLLAILEAGMALAHHRRWAFVAYGAMAVLFNPLKPFSFALQVWRMLHAGAGLWLAADHLKPER